MDLLGCGGTRLLVDPVVYLLGYSLRQNLVNVEDGMKTDPAIFAALWLSWDDHVVKPGHKYERHCPWTEKLCGAREAMAKELGVTGSLLWETMLRHKRTGLSYEQAVDKSAEEISNSS